MRIVSWNCQQGLTKEKRDIIEGLRADILVVQECKREECKEPEKLWYGDGNDSSFGIGLFSSEYAIERLSNEHKEEYRYVVPYRISKGNIVFTLFAVWTKRGYGNYHIPVYNALKQYKEKFKSPSILIGDFNTGSVLGSNSAHWYEELRSVFAEEGLQNCAGDQEWCPTFFRENGSWLDDHCFATSNLKTISFGIGNRNYWKSYSDHCPIIVDFDF